MSWNEDSEALGEDLNSRLLQDSERDRSVQSSDTYPNEIPTSWHHHLLKHPSEDSDSQHHLNHHEDSSLGPQHRHLNKDASSQQQQHHRHPNGEPPELQIRTLSEREPLLSNVSVPTLVPDNSDDDSFIQFVASDCPSVVPSSVGSRHGDHHDITSDVTASGNEKSGRQSNVGNNNVVINTGRQHDANSNNVRNRYVGEKSDDDQQRKNDGLFIDVTISPSDVNKKCDVTEPLLVPGPSSPGGSVARSFTSDCIRALGEEKGREEEGEGGTSDHLLHPHSHKAVRRLSSGDKPHCFLTAQDGISDIHNMTLIVPDPSRGSEDYLLGRASPRGDMALVRRTRMTEVAPTNSSLVDDEDQWRMPLQLFTSKKQGSGIGQFKAKRIRSYYKAQDELITAYEDISLRVNDDLLNTDIIKRQRKLATFFSKLTLAINVALLIGKLVASVLSGSISIISSLVDSVVDLLSGLIMWWATRAVKTRDPYTYPQGRTKLEPVAIIILSVVMALASLQLVRESVEKVVTLASDPTQLPRMDAPTFAIAGSTVVVKLVLWLVCRRVRSSIVQALAMDHRNDVLSNTVAIVCGYLGSREFQQESDLHGFIYVDPAGAILISLYIVINWWQTGSEQIKMLTGHTARPDFLSKLTWTAMNHDRNIRHIDTVRAFHFGNNFLVEMDIVLPEDMSLRVAHDIGESLQQKLENIPEVERAFVHLDYEFSHNPNSEHKVV